MERGAAGNPFFLVTGAGRSLAEQFWWRLPASRLRFSRASADAFPGSAVSATAGRRSPSHALAAPLRFPDFKFSFITVRDTVEPGFNRHRDFGVTPPANNRSLALAVPGSLGAAVQKALRAVRVTGGHLRSQQVTIVSGFT